MKKILSIILTTLILFSGINVMAEDLPETVEITFKVGDSVLSINGQPVEVKAPYVVGEGTTLVPLRVITEAFGCKVDWDETTQGITITYPDVTIKMQIGNINVTVNDHTETLLAAPILDVDTTMVPLRFISETFGAEVSYDEATEGITVKKTTTSEGQTITGITDKTRIGDSFYGWSMNTPDTLTMLDRDFDGTYTEFAKDDITLDIYVYIPTEDETFDSYFTSTKQSFSGYTLVKADRLTDENKNKYMHFQAKDKEYFYELINYRTNKYAFETLLITPLNSNELNSMCALTESFKCSFGDTSSTHDLSNVNSEGYRKYTNENLGYTIYLPSDWDDYNDSPENEMYFTNEAPNKETFSEVHFTIYSKKDDITAEKLANKDHDINAKYINTDIVSITDVAPYQLNQTISGYAYTISTNSENATNKVMTDVFFEKGQYVYNVSIHLFEEDRQTVSAKDILSSISAKEIDFSKVGVLLRNDTEEDYTYNAKFSGLNFTFTGSWTESKISDDVTNFINLHCGTIIGITNLGITKDDIGKMTPYNFLNSSIKKVVEDIESRDDCSRVKRLSDTYINGVRYCTYTYYSTENENLPSYITLYATVYNDNTYVLYSIVTDELNYCDDTNNEIYSIISNVEVTK